MTKTPKVALITGAARRVGAEIARTLHAAGISVALHYRKSETEAKELCHQLNQERPHSAMTVCADLSDMTFAPALIDAVIKKWGQLDILVNNASRFYKTKIGKVMDEHWNDLMDSNLKAPFFLSQCAVPYLEKQQGCIVNIGDVHAQRPMGSYAVYCISKAGLIMLTQTLAKELAPRIRVNAVSPGAVIWPEGENELNDQKKEKILGRIALNRPGSAKDVAKAVLFLIQDAEYVTGQVLTVDGGRSLLI